MKRLPMRKIREVLRLRSQGFSGRRAAHSLGLPIGSVQNYLARADAAGVDWTAAECLGDRELESLLFPRDGEKRRSGIPVPDWRKVHRELRRKGVTLSLPLEEYQTDCGCQGYSYSRFCDLYREWEGRIEPVMRQRQAAGERIEVDYAGMTVPIHCPKTGETRQAQVFVAAMGASGCIYAEATESQKIEDWTGSHVRALSFYGGVPEMIVLDNLKSGIARSSLTNPKLNPTFADLFSITARRRLRPARRSRRTRRRWKTRCSRWSTGFWPGCGIGGFSASPRSTARCARCWTRSTGGIRSISAPAVATCSSGLTFRRCARFRRIPGSLCGGSRAGWTGTATSRPAAGATRCRRA